MEYDVTINRLEVSTLIDVQGDKVQVRNWVEDVIPQFPEAPNTASNINGVDVYWVGATRWLIRTEIEREQELLSLLKPSELPADISIVQISDTQQFFSIMGSDAGEVISIASPIDFHSSVFPDNGVSFTDIFGVKGMLVKRGEGFEIAVERSFADMVEDFIQRI